MFDPSKYSVQKAKSLPVILLIDTSGSMGEVIDTTGMVETGETVFEDGKLWNVVKGGRSRIMILNECCQKLIADFQAIERNEIKIEVAIFTFGKEVKEHLPLTTSSSIVWKDMDCEGDTPLAAVLDMVKDRIEKRAIGSSNNYRPEIILISDGRPDSGWESSLSAFVNEGRSAKCGRMAMGIGKDFDPSVLEQFVQGTENPVFSADDVNGIKDFFRFVSTTVTTRTKSKNPNAMPSKSSASGSVDDASSWF